MGTDLHDKGPTHKESPSARLSDLDSKGNIKEVVRDVKPENVSKVVDENDGEPVTVDLNGRDEAFLTNISVIDFTHGGERLFSLELTIENPIRNTKDRTAPASGRSAQHTDGVSDVRLAAFESFVKKEKTQIERTSREKGLIPWRVDESRVHELQGEAAKVQKKIDALLAKFGGDEEKLNDYRRDRRKLYELRELLERKESAIAAEYKPEGMADVPRPIAPNGKPSRLSVDQWLTVRTKAFKAWFGDWERAAELTFDSVATGWKETKNALKELKGVPLRNLEQNIVGYINRDQRNELSNPDKARISADNGFSTTEHYVAAQHIRELFKHATCCSSIQRR